MGACGLARAIVCQMALLSAMEASSCVVIFFFFFLGSGFVDYQYIHSVIISRGKSWAWRLHAISLTAPVLVIRVCVSPRAVPDPTRILLLLQVLSSALSRIASSILRV